MSSQKVLAGLTALVTRPPPRGLALCEWIVSQGGKAIYLPTIEIQPVTTDISLDSFDFAIFVSPQAVYPILSLPSHVTVIAIGKGTAEALKEARLPTPIYPQEEWNTEGLLALPALQQLVGKKIAIVKGVGGRELLAAELTQRGALVTLVEVYRRVLPKVDVTSYIAALQRHAIDMIICTSNEGMQNLQTLLSAAWEHLQKIPLIVISERMKIQATKLGFKKISVAKNASHNAILEALAQGKNHDE